MDIKVILNDIASIGETDYIPPTNGTSQEYGDHFENWCLGQLTTQLKYPLRLVNYYPDCIVKNLKVQFGNPLIKKYVIKEPHPVLKENAIIYQMLSKSRPPDIVIQEGNKFHPIECKSSISGKPNFGDTPPKPGYHYLFANNKRYSVSYFTGENIGYPEYDPNFIEIKSKLDDTIKEMRLYLKNNRYPFNDQSVKYRMRVRFNYQLSKEIV